MLQTRELFNSVTTAGAVSSGVLARVVGVLAECEEAVSACAAGMLAGKDADELQPAIVQDLDCADVTAATRRVLTRGGHDLALLTAQVEACLIACRLSHELCAQYAAHHEHCRISADSTGQGIEVCREGLAAVRS